MKNEKTDQIAISLSERLQTVWFGSYTSILLVLGGTPILTFVDTFQLVLIHYGDIIL